MEDWREDKPVKKHPDMVRVPVYKTTKDGTVGKRRTKVDFEDRIIQFGWDYADEIL